MKPDEYLSMSFEVDDYFNSIRYFVLGDLNCLQRLSKEAEEIERKIETDDGLKFESSSSMGTFYTSSGKPSKYGYPHYNPVETNIPRGTIPFALMLFSVTEMLGAIVSGKKDFFQRLKEFSTYTTYRLENSEIEFIRSVYRNGMAHNFFPKIDNLISYHSTNPSDKLIFDIKTIDGSIKKCFNLNFFEKLFIEGFHAIDNCLEKIEVFNENYLILIKEYQNDPNNYIL